MSVKLTTGMECPWCEQYIVVDVTDVEYDEDGDAVDGMDTGMRVWAAHDPQACFMAWIDKVVEDPAGTRKPASWSHDPDASPTDD